MLKPLGLSVAGAGCDIKVPGGGVIDLHEVQDPGQDAGIGQVEVTGEQARDLLNGLVSEVPDLDDRLQVGGGAILVMDAGNVAAQIMESGSRDARDQELLTEAIESALNSGWVGSGSSPSWGGGAYPGAPNTGGGSLDWGGGGSWEPVMRVAMCRQHHLPEICPRQH